MRGTAPPHELMYVYLGARFPAVFPHFQETKTTPIVEAGPWTLPTEQHSSWAWRAVLALKRDDCSWIQFLALTGSSLLSVTPVPTATFGPHRYQASMRYTHTCTLNTESHEIEETLFLGTTAHTELLLFMHHGPLRAFQTNFFRTSQGCF